MPKSITFIGRKGGGAKMKCIFVKDDGQRCGEEFDGPSNYCEAHRPTSKPSGTLYTTRDKTWGGVVSYKVPISSKDKF